MNYFVKKYKNDMENIAKIMEKPQGKYYLINSSGEVIAESQSYYGLLLKLADGYTEEEIKNQELEIIEG